MNFVYLFIYDHHSESLKRKIFVGSSSDIRFKVVSETEALYSKGSTILCDILPNLRISQGVALSIIDNVFCRGKAHQWNIFLFFASFELGMPRLHMALEPIREDFSKSRFKQTFDWNVETNADENWFTCANAKRKHL